MENPTSTRSLGQKTAHGTRNHPPKKKFDDCEHSPFLPSLRVKKSRNLQEPHPSCVAVRGSSAAGPATRLATQDHSLLTVEFRSNCLGHTTTVQNESRNPLQTSSWRGIAAAVGLRYQKQQLRKKKIWWILQLWISRIDGSLTSNRLYSQRFQVSKKLPTPISRHTPIRHP